MAGILCSEVHCILYVHENSNLIGPEDLGSSEKKDTTLTRTLSH